MTSRLENAAGSPGLRWAKSGDRHRFPGARDAWDSGASPRFSQILLIHASQLNADLMPDLLAMFRRRGYRFVSLSEALADPAYRQREEYVGCGGFSWIHRWSKSKGMAPKGEPDPPQWVEKSWRSK